MNTTFCPPNITLSEIWVNHGTSKCFMDTVGTSFISLYLLIFGTIQLWIYKKYSTENDPNSIPKSKLYNTQKFVLYFLPVLSIVRLILQATVFDDKTIYGYMVRDTNCTHRNSKILLFLYLIFYVF